MLTDFDIKDLFFRLVNVEPGVSDVFILSGYPFQVMVYGTMKNVFLEDFYVDRLTPFQTEAIAFNLLKDNPQLFLKLFKDGYADFSYFLDDNTRFRVNVFSRQKTYNIIMRKLDSRVKGIDEWGLPEVFYKIAKEKFGIVLVTGATGQGKTTTLAAILHEINKTQPVHILTLEDPIEYLHQPIKATINQRELGTDFSSYAEGLRAALREAPHVILVGEIRDRETMDIALMAAETGHLVFSTLHTIGASQTINRVIGFYPPDEENFIRQRLASSLRWVIGQKLLPKIGGGRIPVFDILYNNLRVKEIILTGESEGKTFYDAMTQGKPFGMQTFDQHLIELYEKNLIEEELAVYHALRKDIVGRQIDLIKKRREVKEEPTYLELGGKGVK
ncbi:PilT/PilU family type 4a pilus ATPase [Thermodesulfobacterium sp. TA1]|uniref:type IV pilus twitching motility protein PilT n=1 Tax=Thermodesulfobacterium sp. TA1 TaxID=2234087 RepID=UPI001231C4D2|nr:PilT/PilU family type 4a pilus ATPase [Thermodesulfobacterium sp. TA1]QER42183.1 PilT/PilU family type 4a pilus ATPase [Thermodesulfobacterium sp. TA1]